MEKPYSIVPTKGTVNSKNMYGKSAKAALKLGLFEELPNEELQGRYKSLLEKSFGTWNHEWRVPTILRNLAQLEAQIGGDKSLDTLTNDVAAARLVADHPSFEKERETVLALVRAMVGEISPLVHE